jgi:Ca-activated chloride channel family protein
LFVGPFIAAAVAQSDSTATPSQQDQTTIKSDVNLVSVYFTVRDRQKSLVSDLPQSRFKVFEDGKEQPIRFFAQHSDVVLNVGLMLDTGTNMSWILNEEADAASLFMKHVVRKQDLGFILGYAARVETIQVPTADTIALKESVDEIRKQGTAMGPVDPHPQGSAPPWSVPGAGGGVGPTGKPYNENREAHLYDAVRVGTNRYLKHEIGRKAIVIVALSGDSRSESSWDDALDVLLENDVIAYVLQIYDPPHDNTYMDHCDVRHVYGKDEHGEQLLKKLAESTGGRMLEVYGMDKISEALDQISDELHHQYSLGYYPSNLAKDGKFRKIKIDALPDGYKVYARKGYYPPRPNNAD